MTVADDKTANREVRIGSLFVLAHVYSHALEQGKQFSGGLTVNIVASLIELCKKPFYAGVAAQSVGLICRYCDISSLPAMNQTEVRRFDSHCIYD